jgi:dTMP kinase
MFITFEGPEGSGKSTQAQLLARYLAEQSHDVVLTREPGGTVLGDHLRDLLLSRTSISLTQRAQALLFCAARAQLVSEVIKPHLEKGAIVICDRYADSTLAYQSYGGGLALDEVEPVVAFATSGLSPDLTILLDLEPATGLGRKTGIAGDRYESEALAFHRRVRSGYLALAERSPERWSIVDAGQPAADVAAQVRLRVQAKMRKARG